MKDEIEIYDYRRVLEGTMTSVLDSEVCSQNKKLLVRYKDFRIASGLSLARTIKDIQTLKRIALLLEKPFDSADKNDMIELVNKIEIRMISAYTKHDYKLILKQFYKWLRDAKEFPEEVGWIKVKQPKGRLLPEELVTTDEVKAMIQFAPHPRDKAFVAVLYESACRIGEILRLKIKHVTFDRYGAQLVVNGKTGPRRVRILGSSPLLAAWLDSHPSRDSPEAPVWICTGNRGLGHWLRPPSAAKLLRAIAERAGLKKRIYPHLFRHSRLTELAKLGLNEFQLRCFAGWTMNSDQSAVYVHMSGKDVDDALLRISGLEGGKEKEVGFELIECKRCSFRNHPGAKLCNRCGFAIDLKYALRVDRAEDKLKQKAASLTEELVKSPRLLDTLVRSLGISQDRRRRSRRIQS